MSSEHKYPYKLYFYNPHKKGKQIMCLCLPALHCSLHKKSPDQKQGMGCLYLSTHLPLSHQGLGSTWEVGYKAPILESNSPTFFSFLPFSSLEAFCFLVTRNAQLHLLPNLTRLMFGLRIFAHRGQEFGIFVLRFPCVSILIIRAGTKSLREQGKRFHQ